MSPIPKDNIVIGQGKGQPFIGLGRWVTIRNTSYSASIPAIKRKILAAVYIFIPPDYSSRDNGILCNIIFPVSNF
jgi:hypothetical protein